MSNFQRKNEVILVFVVATFVLNIAYLVSFRSLMTRLEVGATAYWENIGRPNSFSGNHVSAVLSNLYRKKMTLACEQARVSGLLGGVRVLLPATFVVTGYTLYSLSELLNNAQS